MFLKHRPMLQKAVMIPLQICTTGEQTESWERPTPKPTGSLEKQLEKLMETSSEAQLGLPKPGALSIVSILPLK